MQRNISLDYFKIVLSILVVTIHVSPLFGKYTYNGWIISYGIARIAVPCFFIISGYYFYSKNNKSIKEVIKYLLHLVIIYVTWCIIYSFVYKGHFEWMPIKSIIYQHFWGFYILWFFSALILGLIILSMITRLIKNKYIFGLITIIILILGYYLCSVFYFHARAITGLGFLMAGYAIKENNLTNKLNNKILVSLIIIGFVLLILQNWIDFQTLFNREIFLSQLFLCPAFIIYILKNGTIKNTNIIVANLSAAIYFLHAIVLIYFHPIHPTLGYYSLSQFLLILVFTIILSIPVIIINKKIKIFL